MRKRLPILLDGPEKQTIGVSIIFSVVCFFSLPFVLLLWLGGYEDNLKVIAWFEIVFQIVTFAIAASLFREFLREGWDTVRFGRKEVMFFVKITAGIVLGIELLWYLLYVLYPGEITYMASYGTLPISEMNLFMLPAEVVVCNPVFGSLCMVLLVPLTISCLYYAVGFMHPQNVRPWLGYLVVAVVIALPRIANAATYWLPLHQMILYFAQLPVHLVACWGLRRTNTIWTPIFVHMAANLVACLILIFTYVI